MKDRNNNFQQDNSYIEEINNQLQQSICFIIQIYPNVISCLAFFMVEFKYSIIENQNKIMSLLKSNMKASELNLKFLDLKFKSILPTSFHQSTPFSQASSQINNESEKNTFHHFTSKNKVVFSKSVQLTNDVSLDNTLYTDDLDKKLLGYIETSTKEIYEQRSKNQNKIRQRVQKESKEKKQNKFDNTYEKYKIEIKNLEKQKIEIHNEIKKIYFDPSGRILQDLGQTRNFKKKIRNMRVLQNDQFSKIDKCNQGSKYLREQRQESNENDKNFGNLTWTYLRTKVRNSKSYKNNSKNHHLPSLEEDKIQNFYENLYKQKRIKSKLLNEGKKLRRISKQSMREKNEAFEQLKSRMIHCNINKNFESFFVEKNIRVPEILKNLR